MKLVITLFFLIIVPSAFGAWGDVVTITSPSKDYDIKWTRIHKTDEKNIIELISHLERSKTGRKILRVAAKKAAEQGYTINDIVKVGDISLTDTTLIRKFSAHDPSSMIYESRSKVYVNRNLNLYDAILDLAHELTHYTYRESFNPYKHNFKLDDFVKTTVEGRGGEVEAFMIECVVMSELFKGKAKSNSRCNSIYDHDHGTYSKHKGKVNFYKVGDHHRQMLQKLSEHRLELEKLPFLSSRTASFISSAYGVPYPIAAVFEYESIMSKVCHNDRERLSHFSKKIQRSPASEKNDDLNKKYRKMSMSYKLRCQKFLNNTAQL